MTVIATFVAFDGMTASDLVGAFDAVTRLKTMELHPIEYDVVARTPAATATGDLRIATDRVDVDLDDYDVVVVPGESGVRDLSGTEPFVNRLARTEDCEVVASVCTGSLLLETAGLLEAKRATTHPSAYSDLAEYCEVLEERIVWDGDIVTARGVTAVINFGLELVEHLADADDRRTVARQMDYPHDPVE